MHNETMRTIRISAKEIKKRFKINGEIVAFSTPSRQDAASIMDRHLMMKIVVVDKKKPSLK